jgi:tetratricopeptide (TPR) repeat protein
MKYEVNREVTILQRVNPSPFVKANIEVYGGTSRALGASKMAENTLLSNAEFLKAVLPTVIGLDKSSGKWQDVVSRYMYGIAIDVPTGGKILNISVEFDIENHNYKTAINKLAKQLGVTIKTNEDLAKYVLGYSEQSGSRYIEEIEVYNYGKPIDPLDYFNYVYCLYHNRVANRQDLINKSPRIEFYLITKDDVKRAKKEKFELSKKINRVMLKIDEDEDLFDAVCSILNIRDIDIIDRGIKLNEIASDEPNKIIEVFNDKHLMTKAKIENYINLGVLKRLPENNMIVDADDAAVIIGSNMEDAITFFNNTKNNTHLSKYAAKLKSL